MFATLAADYPREPRAGEPDRLGDADRQLAAGEIDPDEHRAITREVVGVVIAEQEVSGLAILSDGGVAHGDRLRPLLDGLGGTSTGTTVELPDGALVDTPRFDGHPDWHGPITVDDWRAADEATDQLVKQVLVGPFTIASLAESDPGRRETLALALAEALNAEARALADAGCPLIQIDEGAATSIGDDEGAWRLFGETQRRMTRGLEDHHLCLGLYRGAIHPAGHPTLVDGPYRSFLIDAFGGPDAWRSVWAIPPERGVIIGGMDARLAARDETEVMVWAMAWAEAETRTPARVGIAPNGSLRAVGRHLARRKIELMGEAVRIASMGPLREVAQALDQDPLHSTMAPLRAVAEMVEAARPADRQTPQHETTGA